MKKIFNTSTRPWQFAVLLAFTWLIPATLCFGQTWRLTTDMPVLKNHHSAIAASNGKIYLFGGGANTDVCSNDVYEFNPTDSSFTLKAPMPGGRCGAAVEEVNGKIYVFGGFVNQFGGLASNSVYEFDPNNNGGTWTTLTNMPTKRAYASATKLDNKIYVIGGAGDYGQTGSNAVEVFEPGSLKWLAPAPSLLKTRGGHVSHEIGGKIYVMGGTPSLQENTEKTVEMFDPANGGYWSVVDSIPTPRLFLGSCKGLDNKIYAAGGYNRGVGPTLPSVDVYDPQKEPRWDAIAPMNVARRGFAIASAPILNGFRIYAFGGNNEAAVLKSVEFTDIAIVPNHEVKKTADFDPQLHIFPNPSTGLTTIQYMLPVSDEVQFSLYDHYGRLIQTLVHAHQWAGTHSLEFEAGALPKGVYIGILRTGKGPVTPVRLVVQ